MYREAYHLNSRDISWSDYTGKELGTESIHIYKASLNPTRDEVKDLLHLLSLDEIERASKYYFTKDKNRYIKSRGILRKILGSYLSINPKTIKFEYSQFGKPSVVGDPIYFNTSHSNYQGLLAVSQYGPIGVDIEAVKPEVEFDKLVSRFFSINESELILGLDISDRAEYFYKCWTRKESFIKAHGEGLSMPLDCFQVSILDNTKVTLRSLDWQGESHMDWHLRSFDVLSNAIGAVTIKGKIPSLEFWDSDLMY